MRDYQRTRDYQRAPWQAKLFLVVFGFSTMALMVGLVVLIWSAAIRILLGWG